MNVDYSAKIGMTQEECETFVNKQLGVYPVLSRLEISLPKQIVLSEKVCVLDTIYKVPSSEVYYKLKRSDNNLKSLRKCSIKLSKYTSISELDGNIIFYNVFERKTYSLSAEYSSLADMIRNNDTIRSIEEKYDSTNVYKYLSDLIYYGFINVLQIGEAYVDNIDGYRIGMFSDVMWDFDKDFNMFICMNSHTSNMIRVNRISKTILQLFVKPQYFSDIISTFQSNDIHLPEENVNSLVNSCLKQGIMYLVR